MINDKSSSEDQKASTEAESKKTSPAEAFARLETALWQVHGNVAQIDEFIQKAKEILPDDPEEFRREGRCEVFKSLFQLHDFVFNRVLLIESGEASDDSFVTDTLKYIANELERHDVYVFRPEIGSPVDLRMMQTLQAIPAKLWQKSDTVAKVHRCGFAFRIGDKGKMLRMADVDVYRKGV